MTWLIFSIAALSTVTWTVQIPLHYLEHVGLIETHSVLKKGSERGSSPQVSRGFCAPRAPLIRLIINVCVLHVQLCAGCVACGKASICSGTNDKQKSTDPPLVFVARTRPYCTFLRYIRHRRKNSPILKGARVGDNADIFLSRQKWCLSDSGGGCEGYSDYVYFSRGFRGFRGNLRGRCWRRHIFQIFFMIK